MYIIVAHAYNRSYWLVVHIHTMKTEFVQMHQLIGLNLVNRDLRDIASYSIWGNYSYVMYLLGKYKEKYILYDNSYKFVQMTKDELLSKKDKIYNISDSNGAIRLRHGKLLDIPLALLVSNVDNIKGELLSREKDVERGINMRSLKDLSNGNLPISRYINPKYRDTLMIEMAKHFDLGRLLFGTHLNIAIEEMDLDAEVYTTVIFGENLLVKLDELDYIKKQTRDRDKYIKTTREFMDLYTEYLIELIKCSKMFDQSFDLKLV